MLCGRFEGVVSLVHVGEGERVRDERARVDFTRGQQIQKQGRGDGVDEPGGDGDVVAPQLLDLQLAALAVHADVGEHRRGRQQVLGQLERLRVAHRFNHGVAARLVRQGHDGFLGGDLPAVDGVVGAQLLGDFQPVRIPIDGDDEAGRVELGRHEGGEPDGADADDGDRRPGLDFAIENATLESRR